MSKYIIELGEEANMVQAINVTQNGNVYVNAKYVTELKELTSDYINEHFGSLQDDAYQRGLEKGKQTAIGAAELREKLEYQRGLDDAWEAAKKIALMDTETSENVTGYFGLFRIMENLTPMQALEKLKAYEEKQKAEDEIKVGDEVIERDGNKILVSNIHGELFDGLCSDGSTICDLFLEDVVKTGRHFDIASILEDMRND